METRQLDVRGTKCPVPIVRAKKEIDGIRAGELLEQRTETDQTGRAVYVHLLERRG